MTIEVLAHRLAKQPLHWTARTRVSPDFGALWRKDNAIRWLLLCQVDLSKPHHRLFIQG
jgi:hypothetical protein